MFRLQKAYNTNKIIKTLTVCYQANSFFGNMAFLWGKLKCLPFDNQCVSIFSQDSSHPDDHLQLINFMLLLDSNDFLFNPTITYVLYQTIWLRSKFHCINITSLNLETKSVVQGQTSARADIGKHQGRYPFTVEIWALSTIDTKFL